MTLDTLIEILNNIKEANPDAETEIEDELFVMFPIDYLPSANIDGAVRMGGGYMINADS